ncbi:hypothetical protein ABEB36_005674 [Hypothenemus hampei]|uniref:Uncharacterized protein n=1 Tax=Hypothenemus hampei TaxID=57062 RepID=A0ABD1EZ25_HYPHA
MDFSDFDFRNVTLYEKDNNLEIKCCNSEEPPRKLELDHLFKCLQDRKWCEDIRRIRVLNLSNCHLRELPKAIELPHLCDFNLSGNELTTVPSCLYYAGLTNIKNLDLSKNQIGNFDLEPNCVVNLQVLKLQENEFENIPSWFLTFRCTNLGELDYSHNGAEHYNFLKHSQNFNNMSLKKIILVNSCLIDSDLLWLQKFKKLEYLDISNELKIKPKRKTHNRFNNWNTIFLNPQWDNMKILKLNDVSLSIFPENIFWIVTLVELHVSNNVLSWLSSDIKYLENLEVLNVSNNELIVLPNEICLLSKLRVLKAASNLLEEIVPLPQSLEHLDFYDNNINTLDISIVEKLKFVDIDYNYVCMEKLDFDYEQYKSKRDQLRSMCLQYIDRECFDKQAFLENIDSSDKSCESDYEYGVVSPESSSIENSIIPPYENWDDEYVSLHLRKNLDITLSDDEFNEEVYTTTKKIHAEWCNLYSDEEWYFVDAD